MEFALVLLIGLAAGSILTLIIVRNQQTNNEKLKDDIKNQFGSLSMDALQRNSTEFLKLANETMNKQTQTGILEIEGKKKLIDQTLEGMQKELGRVEKTISDIDKESGTRLTKLTTHLEEAAKQTKELQDTTSKLRMALANTKVRGQWGERMAEDVLQLAGFVEGVNYNKQITQEESGTRPDYTFMLPHDLKLNMDVKFPLDNYLHFLEVETEDEKQIYKAKFISDVRQRIGEVAKKEDYINTNKNTLNYALVFIPNEQVYCFINENDGSILDESLKNRVILCSPMTLYAILAVIRQAIDNFNIEKTAAKILSLFGTFNTQWVKYKDSMDKMGKKIEDAHHEFDALVGTRRRKLEQPLLRIEELRKDSNIQEAELLEIPENDEAEDVR